MEISIRYFTPKLSTTMVGVHTILWYAYSIVRVLVAAHIAGLCSMCAATSTCLSEKMIMYAITVFNRRVHVLSNNRHMCLDGLGKRSS